MKNFELLKRTYPISQYDRLCDGFKFIMKNTTPDERHKFGISENSLKKIIKKGEKYIYQVAKEGKEFKIMCLSFPNYEIIRKYIFKFEDE